MTGSINSETIAIYAYVTTYNHNAKININNTHSHNHVDVTLCFVLEAFIINRGQHSLATQSGNIHNQTTFRFYAVNIKLHSHLMQ